MRLHDIRPAEGATKKTKRVGRGESSGLGKTSGRGNKGQRARSGAGIRIGFEGGQMPMHRRLPKKGFTNGMFKKIVAVVNLDAIETNFEDGASVDEATLRLKKLVSGRYDAIKILGNGNVTKKLSVSVAQCSASAKQKIEKAGGTVVTPA